ncbi:MAG: IclR family transcriptional regulator [Pseudomonadota bacterium]
MSDGQAGAGTVGKALEVLDQVASYGRPVRFGELLSSSRFPKATLYRLIQSLASEGMLAFDPERQTYALGVRLVRLAHAAWETSSLAPVARMHVEALARKVGETVHLAQLDHASVLYVDKVAAHETIPMFAQAGKVGPAYCTGVGKAMLAFLPPAELETAIGQQSFHPFTDHTVTTPFALQAELEAIRDRGFAFDREEHEPGIICVALPILTARGRLLGALSVTSSTARTTLRALEERVPTIRATAQAIAEEAMQWRFPDPVSHPAASKEKLP